MSRAAAKAKIIGHLFHLPAEAWVFITIGTFFIIAFHLYLTQEAPKKRRFSNLLKRIKLR